MSMDWLKRKRAASTSERDRRSKFEEQFERQLQVLGLEYAYEKSVAYFVPPVRRRHKTWDWTITLESGKQIIIETKGWWQPAARLAEIEAIAQNPDLDVRYVFQNSRTKIRKGSKTTYADVCRKHDILFAEGAIPRSWLDE